MSIRNAASLLFIGIAQIALGFVYGRVCGLLWWSGAGFFTVGLAYARHAPSLFGKRADGTLTPWRVALLWPYLLFTWTVWLAETLLRRGAPWHQIATGLWLGWRVDGSELPPNISLVVDLTAEFPESKSACQGRTYLCLPTLDGSVTDDEKLQELVQTISAWPGDVYVHCALGRGRSALVVAAVLIAKGVAPHTDAATLMLTQARPGVKLNKLQQAFLRKTLFDVDGK